MKGLAIVPCRSSHGPQLILFERGGRADASEAVRDALRALQQRRREDALKLKALRLQIKAGVEALDRGDFVEVDDAGLDDYLAGLTVPSHKRAR